MIANHEPTIDREPDLFNPRRSDIPVATGSQSPSSPLLECLLTYLRGKGWVKREIVFAAIGVSDRTGRRLKSEACGAIITSSGVHGEGYKLTIEATPGEVDHALNERRSRMRALAKERREIRRTFRDCGRASPV